jgi:hypothetical protein
MSKKQFQRSQRVTMDLLNRTMDEVMNRDAQNPSAPANPVSAKKQEQKSEPKKPKLLFDRKSDLLAGVLFYFLNKKQGDKTLNHLVMDEYDQFFIQQPPLWKIACDQYFLGPDKVVHLDKIRASGTIEEFFQTYNKLQGLESRRKATAKFMTEFFDINNPEVLIKEYEALQISIYDKLLEEAIAQRKAKVHQEESATPAPAATPAGPRAGGLKPGSKERGAV